MITVHATSDRVPLQTEIAHVFGAPEGRDYAPAGYVEVDDITGYWWWKSTNETLNTGWQRIITGGAPPPPGFGISFIYWQTVGPYPAGPPPLPDQVWTVLFRDGSPTVHWDPFDQQWH